MSVSSAVTIGDQQSLISLIGATGALQFFDANNNFLAQAPLTASPAAVICGETVVFNGLGHDFGVSSNAPVGATPAYANLVNSAAQILISGLPVTFATAVGVVLASSYVVPGGSLSVAAAFISSAVR